jgi:hypothetical protein
MGLIKGPPRCYNERMVYPNYDLRRRNPDNEIKRLERMAYADPGDSEIAGRLERARRRAGIVPCEHCGEIIATDCECDAPACRYIQHVAFYLEGVEHFEPGLARGCAMCGTENMDQFDYEELEGEPYFTNYPCEVCNSHLGGDRYPAHGFFDDEMQHFNICTDCFNYFHFGDTPEDY